MPLSEQDLNGFDFSGSDLRNTGVERAKGDSKTVFSGAIFDGPSLDPAVINFNRQLKEMRFSEVWNNFEKALNREPRCFDVISFTTVLAKQFPGAALHGADKDFVDRCIKLLRRKNYRAQAND